MGVLVIYDSDHPGARQNICFSDEHASTGPGHSFTVDLGRSCRALGINIVTADIFLEQGRDRDDTVLLITDMVSANTDKLIGMGAKPFLCLSTESPLIARRFYMNIRRLAGRYMYNMQFKGTWDRLKDTGTVFTPMYYPVESRVQYPSISWKDRKFLVLINRNKRAFFSDKSTLKNQLRSIASRAIVQVQRLIDPWIRSKEIYKDRIEAIRHFSANQGFELFGMGWADPIPGFGEEYSKAALRSYKGPLGPGDKLATMSRFKFSVCFENCEFPGYVTEKIFDCFLAGCIPVYFGAPDIKKFVPAETFIDFREYPDLTALENRLTSMSEREGLTMIDAARNFLLSRHFDRHDQKEIVKAIVDRVVLYPKTQPFSYEPETNS